MDNRTYVVDARYTSEDRQRGAVAPIVGGEEVYQKLGVAVHNGAHETSLAEEIEERAWEVFVPHKVGSTELLGVNAEAIGETDERAGHSQLVRAAATAESPGGLHAGQLAALRLLSTWIYDQWTCDLPHDASPSASRNSIEALEVSATSPSSLSSSQMTTSTV